VKCKINESLTHWIINIVLNIFTLAFYFVFSIALFFYFPLNCENAILPEKEIERTNHTSSEDNSRYLLRRFYDSFAVSSPYISSSFPCSPSACLTIRFTQHKDERARRIKLKQSVTNPIPSLTKFHPLLWGTRQTPRKSAALAKVRQIGNHGSHRIKFENAWSNKIKEHAPWILRFHESTRTFRDCAFVFLYFLI